MPIKVQTFPFWYTRGPPESPCGEDASFLVVLACAPNWSLPRQPTDPLDTARAYSLNLWLHRCKTPMYPPPSPPSLWCSGARLLTWQEEAPTPPAQSMELLIRLPQYCMHWFREIKGTVTCCRRTAKAWARGKKHHYITLVSAGLLGPLGVHRHPGQAPAGAPKYGCCHAKHLPPPCQSTLSFPGVRLSCASSPEQVQACACAQLSPGFAPIHLLSTHLHPCLHRHVCAHL